MPSESTETPRREMAGPIVPESESEMTEDVTSYRKPESSFNNIISAPPVDNPVITCCTEIGLPSVIFVVKSDGRFSEQLAVFVYHAQNVKQSQALSGTRGMSSPCVACTDNSRGKGLWIFYGNHVDLISHGGDFRNRARAIGGYHGRPQRNRFHHCVGHSLKTGRQNKCVRVFHIRPGIFLKTGKTYSVTQFQGTCLLFQ